MFGTLYITSLSALSYVDLRKAFGNVETIRGDLVVTDNVDITSFSFLSNLRHVNNIDCQRNKQLIDARLPSLVTAGSITVADNPRLCTSRHPATNANLNLGPDTSCNTMSIHQLIQNTGSLQANDFVAMITTELSKIVGASDSAASVGLVTCFYYYYAMRGA